ncbi:MAG: nucleoside deaminase [Ruminiclostridium sp.]|nr:nucleoside deaminase [Ruminiclostridium sp.]
MLFDEEMMLLAIEQAKLAASLGEVPVGAVITDSSGNVIASAHNTRETANKPTGHAEINAIEQAAAAVGSRRLSECTLYVTLEPCPMCAGAVINSGLKRLVYGAFDEKGGACASVINLFEYGFSHTPLVRSRILESECSALLSDFFRKLRDDKCSGRAADPAQEQ